MIDDESVFDDEPLGEEAPTKDMPNVPAVGYRCIQGECVHAKWDNARRCCADCGMPEKEFFAKRKP